MPKTRVVQRTKRRDRAQTEQRLIETGVKVFAKYGFERTTTRMIAKGSGVNESLIIRYFGTKEGLLNVIVRRFVAEKRARELGYPPQTDLASELLAYARWHTEQLRLHGDFVRIVISRALVDPKLRSELCSENDFDDFRLASRLEQLRQSGAIPAGIDVKEVAYAVNAIVFGTRMFSSLILGEPNEKTLERTEQLVVRYAKGITAA